MTSHRPSERDDDESLREQSLSEQSLSEHEYDESPSEREYDSLSERDNDDSPSEREYESLSDRDGNDSPSECGDDKSLSNREYDEPLSDRDDETHTLAAMNAQTPQRRRGKRGWRRGKNLERPDTSKETGKAGWSLPIGCNSRAHQTEDPHED
jgi:hypothetical protein